ncbi:MAG: hypothetical protein FWH11_09545 [Micrococcales bacterium]|nr:hypothetical protein [Micrococcales bacterium]
MMPYGRATDFPDMARKVADGTADEATFKTIRCSIEHQDTLWQASPYMTDVLIELLDHPEVDCAAVLSILKVVHKAAVNFYPDSRADGREVPREHDLLPFLGEDDEDIVFERYFETENIEHGYYQHWRCLDSIVAARERIESFSDAAGPVGDIARAFFGTEDAIQVPVES